MLASLNSLKYTIMPLFIFLMDFNISKVEGV